MESRFKEINEVLKLMEDFKISSQVDHVYKNKIHSKIKSIIDHDQWYSDEDRELILRKAKEVMSFSPKQLKSLTYSSIKEHIEDYHCYDDGANSDECGHWPD